MLSRVKDHVPGCGGDSEFIAVRHNGTIDTLDSFLMDLGGDQSVNYDLKARELMCAAADDTIDDKRFQELADGLAETALNLRSLWSRVIRFPGQFPMPEEPED